MRVLHARGGGRKGRAALLQPQRPYAEAKPAFCTHEMTGACIVQSSRFHTSFVSLDALSLRSNVTSSIKLLSLRAQTWKLRTARGLCASRTREAALAQTLSYTDIKSKLTDSCRNSLSQNNCTNSFCEIKTWRLRTARGLCASRTREADAAKARNPPVR